MLCLAYCGSRLVALHRRNFSAVIWQTFKNTSLRTAAVENSWANRSGLTWSLGAHFSYNKQEAG